MASNGGLRKGLPDSQDETSDDAAFSMRSRQASQGAAGDDGGASIDDGDDDEPRPEEHDRASCTSSESPAPSAPTPRQAPLPKRYRTKRPSTTVATENRQRRSVATGEAGETSAEQSTKRSILRESNVANRQRRNSWSKEAYTASDGTDDTELAEHVGAGYPCDHGSSPSDRR